MDISAAAQGIRNNLGNTSGVGFEMGVRTLEKANDLVEEQGQAMIRMIEESVVDPAAGRIDTRA
jgi:hypothetical protein